MIAHYKLTVGSLSAISADLGAVSAGSMSGVSISVAGGDVVIDNNGITINNGSANYNRLKWNDGSYIFSDDAQMDLHADILHFHTASGSLFWNGSALRRNLGGGSLGESSSPWGGLFLDPPTDPAGSYDLLMLNTADNQVHRATGAYSGDISTGVDTIHVSRGIVTGIN